MHETLKQVIKPSRAPETTNEGKLVQYLHSEEFYQVELDPKVYENANL